MGPIQRPGWDFEYRGASSDRWSVTYIYFLNLQIPKSLTFWTLKLYVYKFYFGTHLFEADVKIIPVINNNAKKSRHICFVSPTYSQWAFFPNLFHGQIIQIYIIHLSSPEEKKCGLQNSWSLPPCKPRNFLAGKTLDVRIQGCLDITSAQKWQNVIFQISAEKKFPGLTKKISWTP